VYNFKITIFNFFKYIVAIQFMVLFFKQKHTYSYTNLSIELKSMILCRVQNTIHNCYACFPFLLETNENQCIACLIELIIVRIVN